MRRRWLAYGMLLALAAANYLAMALWSGPYLSREAGGRMMFDAHPFGYSQAWARAFLADLTPKGRDFYLHVQHKLDTPFPALFALVIAIGLWWLYAEKSRSVRAALVLIPIAGAVADYLENARVAALLRASRPTPEMITAASQATMLKFIFIAAGLGLVLVGVVGNWKAP